MTLKRKLLTSRTFLQLCALFIWSGRIVSASFDEKFGEEDLSSSIIKVGSTNIPETDFNKSILSEGILNETGVITSGFNEETPTFLPPTDPGEPKFYPIDGSARVPVIPVIFPESVVTEALDEQRNGTVNDYKLANRTDLDERFNLDNKTYFDSRPNFDNGTNFVNRTDFEIRTDNITYLENVTDFGNKTDFGKTPYFDRTDIDNSTYIVGEHENVDGHIDKVFSLNTSEFQNASLSSPRGSVAPGNESSAIDFPPLAFANLTLSKDVVDLMGGERSTHISYGDISFTTDSSKLTSNQSIMELSTSFQPSFATTDFTFSENVSKLIDTDMGTIIYPSPLATDFTATNTSNVIYMESSTVILIPHAETTLTTLQNDSEVIGVPRSTDISYGDINTTTTSSDPGNNISSYVEFSTSESSPSFAVTDVLQKDVSESTSILPSTQFSNAGVHLTSNSSDQESTTSDSSKLSSDFFTTMNVLDESVPKMSDPPPSKGDVSSDIEENVIVRKNLGDLLKEERKGLVTLCTLKNEKTGGWTTQKEQIFSKFIAESLVEYMSNWTLPYLSSDDNSELAKPSDVFYVSGSPHDSSVLRCLTFYVRNPMKLGNFQVFPSSMVIKSLELRETMNDDLNINTTKIYEGPRNQAPFVATPSNTPLRDKAVASKAGLFDHYDPLVVALVSTTAGSLVVVIIVVFCWVKGKKKNRDPEEGYNIGQDILKDVHVTSCTFEGRDLMPAEHILQEENGTRRVETNGNPKKAVPAINETWVVPIGQMPIDDHLGMKVAQDTKL